MIANYNGVKKININKNAFLNKKNVYKLCVGVVIVGIATGLMLGSNYKNESNKSFVDMTQEEINEYRAVVNCNFSGIDKLSGDSDRIVFIRDDEYIAAVCKINRDGTGNFEAALLPGEYMVVSNVVDMIGFKVDNVDQEYELSVNYENGTMVIVEKKDVMRTK